MRTRDNEYWDEYRHRDNPTWTVEGGSDSFDDHRFVHLDWDEEPEDAGRVQDRAK